LDWFFLDGKADMNKLEIYLQIGVRGMNIGLIFRVLLLVAFLIAGREATAVGMPDFYAEPGLNPTRSLNQSTDFDAVDPFTGKLQLHHTDIFIPGNGGMDLEVQRSYTSGNNWNGEFGYSGWTMDFGYVELPTGVVVCTTGLYTDNMANPVLVLPDGSHQVLGDVDLNSYSFLYISNKFYKAECIISQTGVDGLKVTSPEGKIYEMTYRASGSTGYRLYVTKITDKNGNWIGITYDNPLGNGAIITTVTTSDGRGLTYSYTPPDGNGLVQLASITDGTRTWQYHYIDGSTMGMRVGSFLVDKVTLPDNTTWTYAYNGNLGINNDPTLYGGNAIVPGSYQLNSVKTPQGGIINYQYSYIPFNATPGYVDDVVVSSRSVVGGGKWTYSYSPSTGQGVLDTTTVTMTDPISGSRTDTYSHFGYNTVAPNPYFGGCSNEIWKIGLLAQKTIGTTQTESYTWDAYSATNRQLNVRNFGWTIKFDCGLYYPVLTSKTITRDAVNYVTTNTQFDGYANVWAATETGPGGTTRSKTFHYSATTMNDPNWVLHQKTYEFYNGLNHELILDAHNNVLIDTKGLVTTAYTYNQDGTVATMTPPGGATYTYDAYGKPTGWTTPYSTSYGSYMRGIPQSEVQQDGISISRIVDGAGDITSETNGNNKTTIYGYDGLNRLTSIAHPINNPVTIAYGATTKVAQRGSLIETTNYDGFGRPLDVTLGGIKTTYQYDALGRMTFKSNPNSTAGTSYQYDDIGRVTKITFADSSFKSISYSGLTRTVKDENGHTTVYTYYAYGDPDQLYLMKIDTPDPAASITITRDALDHISSVAQAGITRTDVYATNGYLLAETNPESGMTLYGRDEAGNMKYRLAVTAVLGVNLYSGVQTIYGYDHHNRLTSASSSSSSITNTYSNTNKLLTSTYVGTTPSTRSFTYDDNDNLLTDNILVDGYNLQTGYSYDMNDQIGSITYPISAKTVTITPDILGRPTAVAGYINNATYWDSGQVNQISYQNGAVSTYGQNARLWPSSFNTQSSAGSLIGSGYQYDLVGNLTSITDSTTPAFNRVFGYDSLDRLTTINASGSWGTGTIGYDGAGNISSQTFGTSTITYSYAQNLLASVSGTLRNANYGYDNFGDITSDGAGKVFTYDDRPMLVNVSNSNTGTSTMYAYDGLNKRVKVQKNGVATYEFYDMNGKLLAEFKPSQSNKLVEYIYLGSMRIAQRVSFN
jgi:YD repeat-containing protein